MAPFPLSPKLLKRSGGFPLSSISPFSEPHFADSCANKESTAIARFSTCASCGLNSQEFGDICTAFCEPGWDDGLRAFFLLRNSKQRLVRVPRSSRRAPAYVSAGWEIGGNATVMLCDDTPLSSAGFAEYVGRIPAENSSGPDPCLTWFLLAVRIFLLVEFAV